MIRPWMPITLAALVAPACSSMPVNRESRPARTSSAPAASGPAAPGNDQALTPDQLLQARLVDAVARINETLEARGPFPEWPTSGSRNPPPGGATAVAGRLAPEEIRRVIRASSGKFRRCYEEGLRKDPSLQGRFLVSFTIQADGSVSGIESDTDLPDKATISCMTGAFSRLRFPRPQGGTVMVRYPLALTPAEDSTSDVAPPSSSAPAPPPEPPRAEEPPPEKSAAPARPSPRGAWPIAVIDGTTLYLDGSVVGDVKALLELGRMMKLDAAFNALKARREQWESKHPGEAFPGVLGLRADPELSLVVFKSMVGTAAFAGYSSLYVQSPSDPRDIQELAAAVPGLPSPPREVPERPAPALHVHVDGGDVGLIWKAGSTVLSEEKVARDAPDLARKICDSWSAHGQHREPGDARKDALVVRGESDSRLREILAIAHAAESCTRERRDASGATRRVPAFWVMFSIR
jgi:hypothetical protein